MGPTCAVITASKWKYLPARPAARSAVPPPIGPAGAAQHRLGALGSSRPARLWAPRAAGELQISRECHMPRSLSVHCACCSRRRGLCVVSVGGPSTHVLVSGASSGLGGLSVAQRSKVNSASHDVLGRRDQRRDPALMVSYGAADHLEYWGAPPRSLGPREPAQI